MTMSGFTPTNRSVSRSLENPQEKKAKPIKPISVRIKNPWNLDNVNSQQQREFTLLFDFQIGFAPTKQTKTAWRVQGFLCCFFFPVEMLYSSEPQDYFR